LGVEGAGSPGDGDENLHFARKHALDWPRKQGAAGIKNVKIVRSAQIDW
jgi:hypothetical protein